MVSEAEEVPHDELCDKVLEQYLKTSSTDFSSLIPKAIEFYKAHHVRRGERKIIRTPGTLMEALKEGWRFDPWLNSRGGPIIVGEQPYRGEHPALSAVDPREPSIYWVLVKGTPEQIEAIKPFVELPEEEIDEGPEDVMDPYGLRTMFISYNAVDGAGDPVKPPEGYVVMHKDHIYAKGTVYTLPPKPTTSWALAIQLADLSPHLGVDEAHDVITGILDRKKRGFRD